MSEVFTLCGAQFVVADRSSLRRESYLMALLSGAGLRNPMPVPGESAGDFAMRVAAEAQRRGVLWLLLAAALMPVGTTEEGWRPEHAEALGTRIGDIVDEAEKVTARRLVAQVLIPFLSDGLASCSPTPSASPNGVAGPVMTQDASCPPSTATGTSPSG